MNSHEPFYGAIAAMLDVKGGRAAVEYGLGASDYVDQLRGRVGGPTWAEIDLLDSVLARAIGLAIRDAENYDSFVSLLSRRHPEQYIDTLVTIASAPIPPTQNSYRQVLIAIENLFNHRGDVESSLAMFDALLRMINVREIAETYRTFSGRDSHYDFELLDRILYRLPVS